MKRAFIVTLLLLLVLSLASCDIKATVEQYSKDINSSLHGVLDPYLKEDERFKDNNDIDAQRMAPPPLSADPEN